ncbi:hypothetical protein F5B22DRAFT_597328 [Xylaria bambusicola]|uniref:uncharacterized protein n=1 Tax=Xylaria bambusicola TaxID=326684 RepID=UPI0020082A73|nr:uncharacterized protein F5B22DRAFT_597328 [Xylaria bambusicola]KAI0521044.1 hypothetical protein F5B22DRAFT_597328 [Xylaria bambusicola]
MVRFRCRIDILIPSVYRRSKRWRHITGCCGMLARKDSETEYRGRVLRHLSRAEVWAGVSYLYLGQGDMATSYQRGMRAITLGTALFVSMAYRRKRARDAGAICNGAANDLSCYHAIYFIHTIMHMLGIANCRTSRVDIYQYSSEYEKVRYVLKWLRTAGFSVLQGSPSREPITGRRVVPITKTLVTAGREHPGIRGPRL